jgi:hypothetical protein
LVPLFFPKPSSSWKKVEHEIHNVQTSCRLEEAEHKYHKRPGVHCAFFVFVGLHSGSSNPVELFLDGDEVLNKFSEEVWGNSFYPVVFNQAKTDYS